jgi:hypothetical protein
MKQVSRTERLDECHERANAAEVEISRLKEKFKMLRNALEEILHLPHGERAEAVCAICTTANRALRETEHKPTISPPSVREYQTCAVTTLERIAYAGRPESINSYGEAITAAREALDSIPQQVSPMSDAGIVEELEREKFNLGVALDATVVRAEAAEAAKDRVVEALVSICEIGETRDVEVARAALYSVGMCPESYDVCSNPACPVHGDDPFTLVREEN